MNEFKQTIKKILLILGDIVILYASLYLALVIRFEDRYSSKILDQHFVPFTILYIFWITFFYISNFYSSVTAKNSYKFYASVIKSFSFIIVFSVGFFYFFYSTTGLTPKTNLLLNAIIAFIFFAIWRSAYNRFITTGTFSSNVLMLSDENEAKEIIEKIKTNPQMGYKIIDCSSSDLNDLKNFIAKNNIKLAITSERLKDNKKLTYDLYESLSLKIKFQNLQDFYEQIFGKIPLSIIDKIWFLENLRNLDRPLYDAFKKFVDILVGAIGMAVSLPLYPFIILAIKSDSNGPAFIIQKRIGQNNKIFSNIKFRSMLVNDNGKWPEKNDKRITKVGNFLRKMRLDELPQLMNVLKGDISLVGPRPDIIDLYVKLESEIPYYRIRNVVKPGLTGWAQISQELPPHSIEETKQRLSYDFYYLKNKSLLLDIIIILKTIRILIGRSGR